MGGQHEFSGQIARRATSFSKMLFSSDIYAALSYAYLGTTRQLCYPSMCKKIVAISLPGMDLHQKWF